MNAVTCVIAKTNTRSKKSSSAVTRCSDSTSVSTGACCVSSSSTPTSYHAGRTWACNGSSDVEPRSLEVEVALDPPHHLVADLARVPQLDHGAPLGLEQLAPQPLVLERTLLDLAVAVRVAAGAEAVDPEPVEAAQALGGVVPHPRLAFELVQAYERRLGGE